MADDGSRAGDGRQHRCDARSCSHKAVPRTWKARVTADQLLDNGIAQPQFKGVWKLTLAEDGTYRTYNPWDKWSSGVYSANATRIVLSKDVGCLKAGLKGPGIYRWSLTKGKLKLTSVAIGNDNVRRTLANRSIPLWTRA